MPTTLEPPLRPDSPLAVRLNQLRAELIDLAYSLERQRRLDAADVALQLESRLGAWADEVRSPVFPPLQSHEQHDRQLSPSRFA